MKNEKNEINGFKQGLIVNYLMTCFSRKGVKVSDFCKAAGVDPALISHMKKEESRKRVPVAMWDFFNEIYKKSAFDQVMEGKYVYEKGRRKKKADKEALHLEPIPVEVEKPIQHYALEDKKADPVKKTEKVIPSVQFVNPLRGLTDTPVVRDAQITNTDITPPPITLKPSQYDIPPVLQEAEITIGTAIDVLIKAGAKLNISIEI